MKNMQKNNLTIRREWILLAIIAVIAAASSGG